MIKSKLLLLFIFSLTVSSLYAGDPEKGKALYSSCVQCHGDQGMGKLEEKAPKIAGQHEWYIINQLNAFKNKTRINPKMYPYIKDLSSKDYEDLAAFVSKLK